MLNVHLRDQSGREFGGQFRPQGFSIKDGRLLIDLEYCGTKGNKRLTVAWIDIGPAMIDDMVQAMALGSVPLAGK